MRSSSRLQFVFAVILFASLSIKIATIRFVALPDQFLIGQRLEHVLRNAGFSTERRNNFEDVVAVSAKLATCKIWAVEYVPYGAFSDVIAQHARPIGPLSYVYKGLLYEQSPGRWPLTAHYFWRELKRIGLNPPRFPIIAVAASPTCDLSAIPWHQIAVLPR